MRLEVHAKGIRLTQKLRTYIEDRMRFALARFGDRVRRVRVRMTDINGPRGGDDVHCRIQAGFSPHGEIVVEERHRDPFAAVALASDRISYSLSRRLGRLRARWKGRA